MSPIPVARFATPPNPRRLHDPAPAISSEAMYKTAELFQEDSPSAADLLKHSSYVDDLIASCESKHKALKITERSLRHVSQGTMFSQVLAI